jgi:hypothetical protein
MVKWMLGHYFTKTSADLATLELVEVEQPFRAMIRDKAGRKSNLYLDGVRDVVWYDPGYNQLVLGEHKTAAHAPRQIEKRAEMDPQTAGYVFALLENLREGPVMTTSTGRSIPRDADVGRVSYNVLRKAKPKAPKINKDGTVSVAQCDTTAEVYRAALGDQIRRGVVPLSEKQVEFLENLEALEKAGDRYFARVEYVRTRDELERWRSDLFVDAARIREANRDPTRRTRNPGHCNMAWSLPCPYRAICIDDTPEMLAQYRVSEHAHSEVREAETELVIIGPPPGH